MVHGLGPSKVQLQHHSYVAKKKVGYDFYFKFLTLLLEIIILAFAWLIEGSFVEDLDEYIFM